MTSPAADATPPDASANPAAASASSAARKPVVREDNWRVLFRPETGCYVNDHTVFQDLHGVWHVIGITKESPAIEPDQERFFCHGTGADLAAGGFQDRWKVCDFGERAWAPAVAHNGERFVMLYGPEPMRTAISDEGHHWRQAPNRVDGCPPDGNMRDQMVVRLDDETWLMYATALKDGGGAINLFVGEDLLHWRFVRTVWRCTPAAPLRPAWSAAESPFVFRHDGAWFLSVTYTDGPHNYHNTLLFRSSTPFDFGRYDGANAWATLHAHAPEYLRHPETGQWYITSCGWHGDTFQPVIEGAVAITELDWC